MEMIWLCPPKALYFIFMELQLFSLRLKKLQTFLSLSHLYFIIKTDSI